MTYRKFKADHLFTGQEMRDGASVLVTTETGVVQAIIPLEEAGEDVERHAGMLSPGFVNCHCHLELSHLRGLIPEKTGLVDFLLAVMRLRAGASGAGAGAGAASDKRQAASGEQGMQGSIAGAEEAMLDNGIVAVGDICNTTDSLAQKKEGRLYYHNFIEAIGFTPHEANARFERSREVFSAFAQAYSFPIEANSLVPHAPYSVSPELFGLIANFPGNQLLTLHNQESEAENEFYRSGKGDLLRLYQALGIDTAYFPGTGRNSLESILPHFYPNQSLILVHNVATGEEDLRFAMNWKGKGDEELQGASRKLQEGEESRNPTEKGGANLFFCLCPNANLYISGQVPDPELLIKHDCRIVIGTDSLASNHQLSILEELKTLQRLFPRLAAASLLQWATANGAQALQLDKLLGSFSTGKQPGVLLIEQMEEGRFSDGSQVRRLI